MLFVTGIVAALNAVVLVRVLLDARRRRAGTTATAAGDDTDPPEEGTDSPDAPGGRGRAPAVPRTPQPVLVVCGAVHVVAQSGWTPVVVAVTTVTTRAAHVHARDAEPVVRQEVLRSCVPCTPYTRSVTELSEMAFTGVVSSACLTAGGALLVAALLVRCLYAWWVRTSAVHLVEDGRHRLRWHTTRYEIHEEPWPRPPLTDPENGAEVTVYYHARHPHRWTLVAPYRWLWLLIAAGTLLVAAGLLIRLVLG